MKTVSDLIGNEYTRWVAGDVITISTPTGSGKTTFIIETLLKWAKQNSWRILYLVNRRILKEQIQQRISTEIQAKWGAEDPGISIGNYISVWTYQTIEEYLKKNKWTWLDTQFRNYTVAVFDECHYFCADSVFNPATALSWEYLISRFDSKIKIFMSATTESMQYFLSPLKNPNNRIGPNGYHQIHRLRDRFCYDYPGCKGGESDNKVLDYINLHCIDSEAELPERIQKSSKNSKWLIFVDSINKGKKLCGMLEKTYKDNVIFINARYKNDLEAYERVLELKMKASISKQIVIATSVMDNGISFRDSDLQNIVVFADMKESFLQMLGRKRVGDEKVDLYICRRDADYFSSRIRDVDAALVCHERYENEINDIYKIVPKTKSMTTNKTESITVEEPFETVYNLDKQQEVLSDILSNEQVRQQMRKFCYIERGIIRLSRFSVKRLCDMRLFYEQMKIKLQINKDAFFKEQAKWLGFTDDEIEKILNHSKLENDEHALASIRSIIEKDYYEKELGKAQNIEMTMKIRPYIKNLLTAQNGFSTGEITQISDAIKGDRTFSADKFNCFMRKFSSDLPYKMEKKGQSIFWIGRCDMTV